MAGARAALRKPDPTAGTTSAPPVVARHSLLIADPDEANEFLRRQYVRHESFLGTGAGPSGLRTDSTSVTSVAGWFRIDRLRHTTGGRAEVEPVPELMVTVPRAGHPLRRRVGREDAGAEAVGMAPYWRPSILEWVDVDALVGVLELEAVRRVGADLAGMPSSSVRFTGWRPVSAAAAGFVGAALIDLERYLASAPDLEDYGLIRSEQFRHLAAMMLAAFPNTTHTADGAGDDRGGAATVRRAVAFIDSHARDDIGVGQIAAAARIGVRGLQEAFRTQRGQTPTEYLRRVRLDGARDELLGADPTTGVTVAEVAARWGFRHPGRFAVAYRAAHGYPPNEALHA